MENNPKITSNSPLNAPSPAASSSPWMRRIASSAQFNSAPESKAEITDGASLCASGSQVCSGARPILVP
jgi:hypothetical protein